jgi:hypothetical protein
MLDLNQDYRFFAEPSIAFPEEGLPRLLRFRTVPGTANPVKSKLQ